MCSIATVRYYKKYLNLPLSPRELNYNLHVPVSIFKFPVDVDWPLSSIIGTGHTKINSAISTERLF
jgi:hypothetical protein